ncbi:MAG: NAD-dependent epimerase [Myxococcaceae bacterium]|nr:NAD-dependent epimerase [Myxococcaceae bacterium]
MVETRAPADTQILVSGATGFVGSRLFPALEAQGYRVIGGSRDPKGAEQHFPKRTFRQLDMGDASSVRAALEGCQAAVYLVHSMANGSSYEREERKNALIFRDAAADAGVERIVYLGGMPPNGKPSRHLRSRMATGEALRSGKVPTIELQATMVIGSGSESFRMVRDLAARLPVMLLPSWSKSLTEPIAIADVLFAIGAALTRVPAVSRAYPLPGPEVMPARDILARTAKLLGRNPRMYYLPLISPKLSSYWIRLVTRGDHHVTDELVEGLKTDILSPDVGFWKYVPEHTRKGFDDAVRAALDEEEASLSTGALLVEHAIERISPDQPSPPPCQPGALR